jgi:hypothetical protein
LRNVRNQSWRKRTEEESNVERKQKESFENSKFESAYNFEKSKSEHKVLAKYNPTLLIDCLHLFLAGVGCAD